MTNNDKNLFSDLDLNLIDKVYEETVTKQDKTEFEHKILLIDDEPGNLHVLERLLNKQYEVISTCYPEEALKLLLKHSFAVIISDQRMPALLGTEFFYKAKKIQPMAVRIILTGYTDAEDIIESINSGEIYRYIIKPWEEDDILITVKNAIEKYELQKNNKQLLTELKEANTELNERYITIFENAGEGILLVDIESNKIHSFNKLISNMLGYNSNELKNLKYHSIYPEEQLSEIISEFKKQKQDDISFVENIPVIKKDKNIFYSDITSSQIIINKVCYTMYVFRDVTVRKHATEKLKDTIDEKSKLIDKLNELNKLKNEFLGIAAHDMRNPLGCISGFCEILITDDSIADQNKEFLNRINNISEGLLKLVNDLLDINKIESGEIELHKEKVNPLYIIEASVFDMKMISRSKNIELISDYKADLPEIYVDKDKIGEAFINLISNAIKYSPPESKVVISAFVKNDYIRFSVKDQGPGIPENEVTKLYQPFSKISTNPTAGELKTGLGLAIVKKLILSHEGKTWVKSELNKGSEFGFDLPLIIE